MTDNSGSNRHMDEAVRLARLAYDEAFESLQARGFARETGFGRKSAVVSVDWMNAFTDPDFHTGSDYTHEVASSRRVIDAARAADVPVLLVGSEYEPRLRDAGVWERKLSHEGMFAGSHWVQQDERLGRSSRDQHLMKRYPSCFSGTDLSARLVSQGVDSVIIVGATTSGCVRATVVDACSAGFRAIVVEEAVGDRLPLSHVAALYDMRLKYGDVLPESDVLSYLSSLSRSQEAATIAR